MGSAHRLHQGRAPGDEPVAAASWPPSVRSSARSPARPGRTRTAGRGLVPSSTSDSESPQPSGPQTDGGQGTGCPRPAQVTRGGQRGKLPVVGQVRDGPLPGGGTGPEPSGRPRVGRPGGPAGAPHTLKLQGAEGPPRSSGIWASGPVWASQTCLRGSNTRPLGGAGLPPGALGAQGDGCHRWARAGLQAWRGLG